MIKEKYEIDSKIGKLVLRYMHNEDTNSIYEIWTHPANAKYMTAPKNLEEVRSTADWADGHNKYKTMDCHFRVITIKNTGKIIGTYMFYTKKDGSEMEFVYNIKKEYWNNGIASALTHLTISIAKDLKVKKLVASADIDNIASWKALEKHLDFVSQSNYTKDDGTIGIDKNYELLFD